jgi:hypothetical protein
LDDYTKLSYRGLGVELADAAELATDGGVGG